MKADGVQYYIGIMSGTSLDGVDLALVEIAESEQGNHSIKSVLNYFVTLPLDLKQALSRLSSDTLVDPIELGQIAVQTAKYFAEQVKLLLQSANMQASDITAIGCHGVTIRHYPELTHGFTMQITDANTLASATGIDVIADFRGMDVAAGGQGAPLVPAFHQALFAQLPGNLAVLNLGGIANVSILPSEHNKQLLGFDTGPANTLIDQWCALHQATAYDADGQWAAAGELNPVLLKVMLSESYFQRDYPKSTGKELFNLDWLNRCLTPLNIEQSDSQQAQSVQTTLTHLTAKSVADALAPFQIDTLVVCGGGVLNSFLMSLLRQYMAPTRVVSTGQVSALLDNSTAPASGSGDHDVDANAIEAMAFAWLAFCRIHGISANSPSVTGADAEVILGAWYSAKTTATSVTGNAATKGEAQ